MIECTKPNIVVPLDQLDASVRGQLRSAHPAVDTLSSRALTLQMRGATRNAATDGDVVAVVISPSSTDALLFDSGATDMLTNSLAGLVGELTPQAY